MKLANGMIFDGPDGEALGVALGKAGTMYGILFTGVIGSGKTTAARALASDGGTGFKFIDCASEKQVGWLGGWRGWLGHHDNLVLDDFGRESMTSEYGIFRKPVCDFLRALHSAWKAHEWDGRLFVTTNGSSEDLVRHADESIVDRLTEMCVVCRFSTPRRRLAGESSAVPLPETPESSTLRPDDTYTWDDYAKHGINTGSDAFKAALWADAHPSRLMDALRVLRVDLGQLAGEDCERIRAICHAANSRTLWRYVRDVFVYGLCAGDDERAAFCFALGRYAQAVFNGSTAAQSAYNPRNAATFRDWWRRYDLPGLVEDWRRCVAKLNGCSLTGSVQADFRRIQNGGVVA